LKELDKLKIKIHGKKIDDLQPEEYDKLKLEELEKMKENHQKEEKEKEEAANKKFFNRYDYIERGTRELETEVIKASFEEIKNEKEQLLAQDATNFAKK